MSPPNWLDGVAGMTGLIALDKPAGMTSFSAVSAVRRALGEKKAGHTGTLDPMATGVLPVMLGAGTRFIDFLPSHDKAYLAKIMLGTATDTLDITGTVTQKCEASVTESEFREALARFTGTFFQMPPMHSAVSIGGVRLYELARKGIEAAREPRQVTIYSAQLEGFEPESNEFTVSVACSAGTYIRQLAADIGEQLGCPAVLSYLRRTQANGFDLSGCHTLDEVRRAAENGTVLRLVIPVDKALETYPAVFVTQSQFDRFRNGGELALDRLEGCREPGLYRVYGPGGAFAGLGECEEDSTSLAVKRVFSEN